MKNSTSQFGFQIKVLGFVVVFVSVFFSCKSSFQISEIAPQSYPITDTMAILGDALADSTIAPYKLILDKKMNRVIGSCSDDLTLGQPESSLGNFCADAIFKMVYDYGDIQVDFAIQNYGGIRIDALPKGDITRGKIYELMPFENLVTVVQMDGATTLKLIAHMARRGGWPVSKSLHYVIVDNKPVDISINGIDFDKSKNYSVAMPDYIANGGDNCDFLIPMPRKTLDKLVRKAFFEAILEKTFASQPLTPLLDGRVSKRH